MREVHLPVAGEGGGGYKAKKTSPLRPGSHGSLGHIKAKVYGETQHVKDINRATYLKVEKEARVLASSSSTTHSPWGILRNPKAARTKAIFIRQGFKSYCKPHLFCIELAFQKNIIFLRNSSWMKFCLSVLLFCLLNKAEWKPFHLFLIFYDSNEHLVMVLCFNVVISNLRGSQQLGLFTYTVLFKSLQEAAWLQGRSRFVSQLCILLALWPWTST